MPKVVEQIQHNNDVAALKSICCDALSNIGSHIFERLEVKVKCNNKIEHLLSTNDSSFSIKNKWL